MHKLAMILCLFHIQIFYSKYFHPFDKSSEKTTNDSTNELTLDTEIKISATIARELLV